MNAMRIRRIIKNQIGVILLLTMFILSGILVVALGSADLVMAGLKKNRLTGYSNLAFFASEAGMERALWEARRNNYSLPSQSEDNVFQNSNIGNSSSYAVNYASSTPYVTFKSIGSYSGVKRSVEGTYLVGETPVCHANCTGKVCGDDGCGGSCGSCGVDQSCVVGVCISSQIFSYTGAQQTWVVPTGVTSITVDVKGAQGQDTSGVSGGRGGRVQSTHTVTPGETLYIYVGKQGTTLSGGGWNGGGHSGYGGGSGGGASDIRQGGSALANRIVTAGGGGGAGIGDQAHSAGGSGSNPAGVAGTGNIPYALGGGGGTLSASGTGGDSSLGYPGCDGSLGTGGCGTSVGMYMGGGGGGGYYGGGGGGGGVDTYYAGGGGGGSSYAIPSATNVTYTSYFQTGDGQIIISY